MYFQSEELKCDVESKSSEQLPTHQSEIIELKRTVHTLEIDLQSQLSMVQNKLSLLINGGACLRRYITVLPTLNHHCGLRAVFHSLVNVLGAHRKHTPSTEISTTHGHVDINHLRAYRA